jgi:hypothetical protein
MRANITTVVGSSLAYMAANPRQGLLCWAQGQEDEQRMSANRHAGSIHADTRSVRGCVPESPGTPRALSH